MAKQDVQVGDVGIRADNPQTMNDETFGNLVESIKKNGFLQEIVIAEGCLTDPEKKYEVLSGSHRLRAAIIAGLDVIPANNLGNIPEDERVRLLYNLNVRGNLDKAQLQKLVLNMMNGGMTQSEMQELLLIPSSELNMILKELRKNLPKELQRSFDLAKVEIKTIEDISRVLNRLFNEYGNTLELGFMFFDYGGKTCLQVAMTPAVNKVVKELAKKCEESGTNINELLEPIFIQARRELEKEVK